MISHEYETYTINDRKDELLAKIRIVDDLIPHYDSENFRKKYNFIDLKDNYYDPSKIGQDNMFPELSDYLEKYSNIALKSLKYKEVKDILARVFLVSDRNSNFKAAMHIDDTAPLDHGYTLSYHVMGENNCGGTSFYEDFHKDTPLLQVPFKENRLVIFPACIPHTGYTNPGYMYNSKRVIYTLFTILNEV